MKLTNMIRNAFISAAMTDVPSVDYDEQARAIINKALDAMFAKANPGGVTRTELGQAGWLEKVSVGTPGYLGHVYTWAPSHNIIRDSDPKTWAKLQELATAHNAQRDQRHDLKGKLNAIAYSVTTRKALAEALPEFEKYLPANKPAAVRTLPAVANVVADFTKAGWPKGAKKA